MTRATHRSHVCPGVQQTSCDFVCELVGPAALFALAEKGDINPTAICADIHACLPVSGGVAEVVSSMVAPLQLRAGEGAKVTIELDINVTKPAGTGQYIVGVNYVQYPSGGQKHINQNFYELDEGVSKFKVRVGTFMHAASLVVEDSTVAQCDAYDAFRLFFLILNPHSPLPARRLPTPPRVQVVLDTSMCWYCDDTSEDLHEGEYNVYAAVCEGGDCTPEGGARKGSNVVASKNMGQFSIQP